MRRLLLCIFTLICFASCTKTLSCDPAIDEWAKKNVEYYSMAPRDVIVSLPLSRQQAIYRGLPAERKVELWRAKMNLVRASGVLSREECEDYAKLFDFMQPYHYENEKGRKELNIYAEQWKEIMVVRHSWTEEKLIELSHIWMTKNEFSNALLSDNIVTKGGNLPETDTGVGGEVICNCIYSIYCKTSGLGSICDDTPMCKAGDEGCGIVGTSNCTGTCQ